MLKRFGGNIKHQAHTGGNSFEIPNVGNGSGELNRAHTLSAHLCTGNLNAAALADLTLIADALILTAVTFPVLLGPENALAEETALLGL